MRLVVDMIFLIRILNVIILNACADAGYSIRSINEIKTPNQHKGKNTN